MDRYRQGWRRDEIKVSSAQEDVRALARGQEFYAKDARASARAKEAKGAFATEGSGSEETRLDEVDHATQLCVACNRAVMAATSDGEEEWSEARAGGSRGWSWRCSCG